MSDTCKSFSFVVMAAVMHLLVDGICLCALYVMSKTLFMSNVFSVFMTYNVLAFMSQPFTGILVDKMKRMHWILIWAILFLIFAVLTEIFIVSNKSFYAENTPYIVAILLAVGNSLFHVWGGKQTVIKTGNDMRTLGMFVSTGAFGLSLALVLHSWTILFVFLITLCLLATLYIICDIIYSHKMTINDDSFDSNSFIIINNKTLTYTLMAISTIAVFVMFRSYIGETFSAEIEKNKSIILLLGAIAMFGKMSGGWIVKIGGIIKTLIIVLICVTITYLFKSSGLSIVFLGVFMINITMPITLYLANAVLKEREGLAFGILAAALIPGYILAII